MKVSSTLVAGNGAYILHEYLAERLGYYWLGSLNPWYGVFPPSQLLKRSSADIVHGVPDAGPYLAESGSSLVLTFHNYYLDAAGMYFATTKQRLYYRYIMASAVKKALNRASYTVAVSEYTADLVRSHSGFKDVNVILNGVDQHRFRPVEKVNDSFTLLFSGNLTRRKGAGFVGKIADLLPPHILIQCTGGLRGADSASYSGKIEYLSSVSHDQMPRLYQGADALFFPSYREGLCLSVLEAMACGLPVISCNTSSMSELIVDGKGGYLFDSGDITAALGHIKFLAANPNLVEEMGMFNRERVLSMFRMSRMINDYDQVFREVYRRG